MDPETPEVLRTVSKMSLPTGYCENGLHDVCPFMVTVGMSKKRDHWLVCICPCHDEGEAHQPEVGAYSEEQVHSHNGTSA